MRSQINLIRAAADPRSRRSPGEQNGGDVRLTERVFGHRECAREDFSAGPAQVQRISVL
jgi:hypothetical protein